MTKTIFQPFEKPEVWSITNYPAGGGGANALNGVARLFATRTGLELKSIEIRKVIADFRACVEAVLAELPPELRPEPAISHVHARSILQRAFQAVVSEVFFKTYGQPQALLMSLSHDFIATHQSSTCGDVRLEIPQQVFLAGDLDIMNWCRYLPEEFDSLAPHNLTIEDLTAEAARFYDTLKGDGKPLIAIVLGHDLVSAKHMEALGKVAKQILDARFVISSSPRSIQDMLADICD